ncbi:hypothetical protein Btru_011320 [Bulinus truncatus]|nr:hypothetical protein Btru_011320 [Bulinus truncatus]
MKPNRIGLVCDINELSFCHMPGRMSSVHGFIHKSSLIHDTDICYPSEPFIELVTEIWPWVDTLVYSLIPFITITVLNILIIKEVAGARSNRMLLSGSENDNYVLSTTHWSSAMANQRRNNLNEGSRLTALLLTVSCTFLVLTLPNNIVMIITRLWNDTSGKNNGELRSVAQFQLIRAITELLMYTNHSINFFLYCATGHKFRQQILDLFRCPLRHPSRGSNNNTTLTNAQSMRRNSQSVISGGGDVMVVLRSDQSGASSLSLDAKDEPRGPLGEDGNGPAIPGKGCSSRGSLFKSDKHLSAGGDKNLNTTCDAKVRHFVGHSRNLENCVASSKRDGPLRAACYGFPRNHSFGDSQIRNEGSAANGMWRYGARPNNGSSCKIYYSSRKHRSSPLAASREGFGSTEDCQYKDREYIVLQPTIRWCETSVQS